MVQYSHPGEDGSDPVRLTEHNDDIVRRLDRVVPADAETPSGRPLQEYVRRLARVHDAGKLTTWFQQYIGIEDGDPEGPTHHAPLGGLLAFYVLEATGHDTEECLVGYVAVARHHGRLRDVAEYVYRRTLWMPGAQNTTKREVQEQVNDIDETVSDTAQTLVNAASGGEGTWAEFARLVEDREMFERVNDVIGRRTNWTERNITSEFYPLVLQAWSSLVLADKTSAASAPIDGLSGSKPDRSVLTDYIDSLPEDESDLSNQEQSLNNLRGKARRSVVGRVNHLVEAETDAATLTLPTGLGKTLTGLEAAFRLRDETDRERVVYALPFTSIIDQVADEVKEVFNTDERGDQLTIHHHLSETLIELNDRDTDENAGVETMLGESWRSGLTVTTFVQLFESLAGPRNSQSMKLPALYDSVIILDEPQALPHTWWPLVNRLVEILTDEFDAAVIAMTATQPGLFEHETVELVDDPGRFFRADAVERTEYVLHDSFDRFGMDSNPEDALEYDRAANELVEAVTSDTSTASALAVCNTIDSARALTDAVADRTESIRVGGVIADELGANDETDVAETVADRIANGGERALLHLSTRWRPRDRLIAIEAAKRLTERGYPLLAVTTQLVEAGVDISFDAVYRDLAPMDSIVQAAGRCNRSFERERGRVTVWWLAPPGDRDTTPSVAVYDKWSTGSDGNSLLRLTRQAVESVRERGQVLPEATMANDGVQEYYDRLAERNPGRDGWVGEVDKARADELGTHSLIEQRRAVDVIVCRTPSESQTIEEIHELWSDGEYWRARQRLESTRDIRVSIPIYTEDSEEAGKIRELHRVHPESDLRVLDLTKDEYLNYFNKSAGLVLPDDTVDRRFL